MRLLIDQGGSVACKRLQEGAERIVEGPLQEFRGDNFVVGLAPVTTTFVVTAPPHQEGEVWKMIVDSMELTRK
jgi:hypothetical protein